MPVPKRRKSISKSRTQRSNNMNYSLISHILCTKCGKIKRPHHICISCGYYAGKSIIKKKITKNNKK